MLLGIILGLLERILAWALRQSVVGRLMREVYAAVYTGIYKR